MGVEQHAWPDGPTGSVRLGVPPKDSRCSDKPTRSTPPIPQQLEWVTVHRGILTSLRPRPRCVTSTSHPPRCGKSPRCAPHPTMREKNPLIFGLNEAIVKLQSPIPTDSLMPPLRLQARVTEPGSAVVCVRVY